MTMKFIRMEPAGNPESPDDDSDDEKAFAFERDVFAVGEFLTVVDTTGLEHAYRIAPADRPPGI